jgi:hypothetical protein
MWTDGFGEYPMAVVVADDAEAMLCRPVSPCCISPVWALGDFEWNKLKTQSRGPAT